MKPPPHNYAEAATWLGVSQSWLEKQVRRGLVPHSKLGTSVRFSDEDLEQILRDRHREPKPRVTRQQAAARRLRAA